MKKYFYFPLFLLLVILIGCSSDDNSILIEFEDLKIEVSNSQVTNPKWLKEVIASQSVTSETGTFFPGDVYGVTVDGEKYIVVNNYISSNSCISLQLYHLNGEEIPCPNELQHKLFSGGLDQYPNTMLWNGMVEL